MTPDFKLVKHKLPSVLGLVELMLHKKIPEGYAFDINVCHQPMDGFTAVDLNGLLMAHIGVPKDIPCTPADFQHDMTTMLKMIAIEKMQQNFQKSSDAHDFTSLESWFRVYLDREVKKAS